MRPLVKALAQIEEVVRAFPKRRELSAVELNAYKHQSAQRFAYGWEIHDICGAEPYVLRVLATDHLPFEPPRVAVFPTPPLLQWPHLEEQGLLCVNSSVSSHSLDDTASTVINLLQRASQLVKDCCAGTNQSEFQDEFSDYWGRWDRAKLQFISLCATHGTNRRVVAWFAKSTTYLADDPDILLQWLKNRFEQSESDFKPSAALLLYLEKPPTPDRYPSTVKDLRLLLADDFEAQELLDDYLRDKVPRKVILLGCHADDGVVFAGVRTEVPQNIGNGFRNPLPVNVFLSRIGMAQLTGAFVFRADHAWVHGRDHNAASTRLSTKTVLLLGAGSVGSGIAEMLAQSGVGHLIIVDPESMETENASRHVLGVDSVHSSKASALARSLRKRFPHILVQDFFDLAENFLGTHYSIMPVPDLIISAIGGWKAESFITDFSKKIPACSPILFAWLEPRAAAGHAVVFGSGQGCLRCLTTETGKMRVPMVNWGDIDTMHRIPACAGFFQPYGAAELGYLNAMAAELALEVLTEHVDLPFRRSWVARRRVIEKEGGTWNAAWESRYGELGEGGRIVDLGFEVDPHCPCCAP